MMFKKDFPLIINHPEILYLDNAASTQKPEMVIEGVNNFLRNEYANIHRGNYILSEESESHYEHSKELLAELLNCLYKEIIYTANANAAINLMAQTLVNSEVLGKWDSVLLGIRDHHANILPWMSLSKHFWFKIKFFKLREDYSVDYEDLKKQYTDDVKVVSCAYVSNVTWGIIDVKKIKSYLRDDTFFMIDATQAAPNLIIDFQDIGCDAMVLTWHKMMAYTWIGALVLKYDLIKSFQPMSIGWGTIKDVSIDGYELKKWTGKYEAWTPDIIWAVSREYALEYIRKIWDWDLRTWMKIIQDHEFDLAKYWMEQFEKIGDSVTVIWPKENRIALFSFIVKNHENFNQVGEFFAERNICLRCWGHCAYPLHKKYDIWGTCRMSAYLYNNKEDIDHFFEALYELLKK